MAEAVHPLSPSDFNARIGPDPARRTTAFLADMGIRPLLAQAGAFASLGINSRRRPATGDSVKMISTSEWYSDGELNLSVNCLDRHLAEHGNRTALIFEADEPGHGHRWTYRELYEETCRFANLLESSAASRRGGLKS